MDNHTHIKENLDKWLDVWDQACRDGIFAEDEPKKVEPEFEIDPRSAEIAGISLLQEEKTPNPVYPDSVGKDQDKPKAVWVDEDLLKEVEGLKKKLFDLENKLAKIDDSDESTMGKIKSIQKQIDDVSDSLGVKDEPSPWSYKK